MVAAFGKRSGSRQELGILIRSTSGENSSVTGGRISPIGLLNGSHNYAIDRIVSKIVLTNE